MRGMKLHSGVKTRELVTQCLCFESFAIRELAVIPIASMRWNL